MTPRCTPEEHVGPLVERAAYDAAGGLWAGYGQCAVCRSTVHERAIAVAISTADLRLALLEAGCSVGSRGSGRLAIYTGRAMIPLAAERVGGQWTVRGAWHGIMVDARVHDLRQLVHLIEAVDRMVVEYRDERRPTLGLLQRLKQGA